MSWPTVWMLCRREMLRFFVQRNRVVGAIGQPLLFWLLFGTGLNQTFRLPADDGPGDLSFQQYYFPGTVMLIVLFTAIFATISIIEDRREGFLQSVLVAPVPRWSLLLARTSGPLRKIHGLAGAVPGGVRRLPDLRQAPAAQAV